MVDIKATVDYFSSRINAGLGINTREKPAQVSIRKFRKIESPITKLGEYMRKKITYSEPPWQQLPQLCENCGEEICEGDKCYYLGDGVYLCSVECVKEWEGN